MSEHRYTDPRLDEAHAFGYREGYREGAQQERERLTALHTRDCWRVRRPTDNPTESCLWCQRLTDPDEADHE